MDSDPIKNSEKFAPPVQSEPVAQLVEHFFRQQSARLVTLMTRTYGLRHVELVEEIVQETLLAAFQCWQRHGIPREPAAWLQRIARNKLIDALRRQGAEQRACSSWVVDAPSETSPLEGWNDNQVLADSELRMLFACCHPSLSAENRIVLVLKILFGYSTQEAAAVLGLHEERVKKRLQRARAELRELNVALDVPDAAEAQRRLPEVESILTSLRGLAAQLPVREAADVHREVERMTRMLDSQKSVTSGRG